MEIRNFTTFLKVAELQHFSRAAVQLNYTQAAVTLQIKQLEEDLGVKLFDRIGRKVALTPHGQNFVQHAEKIVKLVNGSKAALELPREPSGLLRIGVVNSLHSAVLLRLLPKFWRDYSMIETVITTRPSADLVPMLQSDRVDIIFFAGKKLYDPKWTKVFERSEDVVFVTSAAHRLAGARVELAELLDQSFILTARGLCYRYDLEQFLAARGIKLEPQMETCNPDYVIEMLKNTDSISFLPRYVLQQTLQNRELAVIDVVDAKIQTCIQLIRHGGKTVAPQLEAFIKLIQDYYTELDAAGGTPTERETAE